MESGTITEAIPFTVPLINLEPSVGEPARFGFMAHGVPVFLDTAVRTGGDYGVTVNVTNITQQVEYLHSEVTLWGVPGDARHNNSRGFNCLVAAEIGTEAQSAIAPPCPALEAIIRPRRFSRCRRPARARWARRWKPTRGRPRRTSSRCRASNRSTALDGCNHLRFSPSIRVTPDGQQASTPTGLNVDVHVDQEGTVNVRASRTRP